MYVIFCTGGIDFVGGYSFHEFLQKLFPVGGVAQVTKDLGKMNLQGGKITTGEQVHSLLFESQEVKTPAGWKMIVGYF